MAMKLLIIPLFAILTIATCKPVTDKTELPHSREFYAGYIKAITDNFDQLFETDRQVRSTKDEDDKPKEEKVDKPESAIQVKSSASVSNIDNETKDKAKNSTADSKEKEASAGKVKRSTRENEEETYDNHVTEKSEKRSDFPYRWAYPLPNLNYVGQNLVTANLYTKMTNFQRGDILQPLANPEKNYYSSVVSMIPSKPYSTLRGGEQAMYNMNPLGGVYSQNGMSFTPLPIQTNYLFQQNRSLLGPLTGEARNMISKQKSGTCECRRSTITDEQANSTAAVPDQQPAPLLDANSNTTAVCRNASASPDGTNNNNNNCCCNNNNNNGGSSGSNGNNNQNQNCCCCCCQPCCCHCCHHCCCEPCCHQHCCCCQPCCCHQQCCCEPCCCQHHCHECSCCHHHIHHHDCCHHHHTTHCCPTCHHESCEHCHCHKYPCCCHETHCNHCDCCHCDHGCHHGDCCCHDCCHHDNCCHHCGDCHHDCCHGHGHYGDCCHHCCCCHKKTSIRRIPLAPKIEKEPKKSK